MCTKGGESEREKRRKKMTENGVHSKGETSTKSPTQHIIVETTLGLFVNRKSLLFFL